jgi:alpha-L-fucosidase
VTNYQPDVVWLDGDWENSWRYWKSDEFIAWLYNERLKNFYECHRINIFSPVKDTVVTNDRWGMDTNCVHGGYFTCHDGYNPGTRKAKYQFIYVNTYPFPESGSKKRFHGSGMRAIDFPPRKA